MSEGLFTFLTLRTMCLSLPMRKLISIDDSVSAVDVKTEKVILQNLRENRCGKTTIVVTDSSKFYVKALAKVCDLEQIDMIITDSGLDEEIIQAVREKVPNTVCISENIERKGELL